MDAIERAGDPVALPNGAQIFANVRGDGLPLAFISGLGDDHTLFEPLIRELPDRYRCLVFDNRGAGLSSRPSSPYVIPTWADDAHYLVHQLGLTPCIAIGCSMGGAIAQEWALRHPLDLAGMILISTWAKTDAYLRAVFSHWSRLAREAVPARLSESMMLFSASPQLLEANPHIEAQLLAALPPDPDGFHAQAEACIAHDTLSRIQRIEAPTLVIAGRDDVLTGPRHALNLSDGIPGARIEVLAAGHVPFWERPQQTSHLVAEFTAQNNRPRSRRTITERPTT